MASSARPAAWLVLAGIAICISPALLAAAPGGWAVLPPEIPWNGRSRSLVVAADEEWITPAERSGLTRTPRYATGPVPPRPAPPYALDGTAAAPAPRELLPTPPLLPDRSWRCSAPPSW